MPGEHNFHQLLERDRPSCPWWGSWQGDIGSVRDDRAVPAGLRGLSHWDMIWAKYRYLVSRELAKMTSRGSSKPNHSVTLHYLPCTRC